MLVAEGGKATGVGIGGKDAMSFAKIILVYLVAFHQVGVLDFYSVPIADGPDGQTVTFRESGKGCVVIDRNEEGAESHEAELSGLRNHQDVKDQGDVVAVVDIGKFQLKQV